ncbi:Gfo/Idh/MocA family protein [Sodalinema gerasimenkoae]|uniref:Gfo/Idh/MocA family protein n=1 Tax=Sodalinema gerasimenkoae TaxID=2862348 RepID=UPI001358D6F5|nr:Gfo/Idh/MocA family oxidoreductase [Sodalinema gerasimenkoae]
MTGIIIIGAGRWGNHLIRNILEHPKGDLLAVVDRDRQRLEAVNQRFNLKAAGVRLSEDWHDTQDLPAQGIIVATPATDHESTIREALERGYHVLAEKPLTLESDTAIALWELAQKQQRLLNIDHTYLFNPDVERGAEVLRQGRLGELRYGYAARTHLSPVRYDVDALWDLAIHDIAIFNHWLGEFPVQVQGTGKIWLQFQGDGASRHLFPDGLADLAWARLVYPSGVETTIHLCWANPDKQRRLAVVGSAGTLVFDELAATPLTLIQGQLTQDETGIWQPSAVTPEAIEVAPGEPLRRVCDRFLEGIETGQSCDRSSGWVGAQLVRVLESLSQSCREGGRLINLS